MAEYYPLLARAVAGLGTSTPEIRRGIYERARKALLGQLKSIEPPVPDEDIERESRALDAAVEKLEVELVAKEGAKPAAAPTTAAAGAPSRPSLTTPPPRPMAPRPPLAPRPPSSARPLEPRKDGALANGASPASPPTSPRAPLASNGLASRPVVASVAAALARPPSSPPREAPARTTAPSTERRPTLSPQTEASLARNAPVEAKAQPGQVAPAPAPEATPPVTTPPAPEPLAEPAPVATEAPPKQAPTLRDNLREFSRPRDALTSDFESVLRAQDTASPQISPSARGEPIRPIAQRPAETERRSLRHWIIGTVVLVVVAVVAIMAFILRDNPVDLVKRAPPPATADTTDQGPGKIVARIGVSNAPAASPAPAPAQPAPVPATTPVPASAPPASVPPAAAAPAATPPAVIAAPATVPPAAAPPAAAPATSPVATSAPVAPQPATTPATSTPAATNPALPVAQRAALVVDAPNTQQKVQTYVGWVVWRLENVSKGAGQPLAVALRADITVPDAKFTGSMELEKNTDAALPASHTIELKFTFASDSPVPAVQRIDTPYMRDEAQPQGDALAGAVQQVVPNYFLVALAQDAPTVARNLNLITSRGWMDVPILLADGRVAKLTFEKGTSGDQMLQQALAAWQN